MHLVLARDDFTTVEPERFDMTSSIHHWPFPGGKLLRRSALAIGMLYFKLMDAL
jgi:hypothetical protein